MVGDTVRYVEIGPYKKPRRSQHDAHLFIGGIEVVRRVLAFDAADALIVAAGGSRTNSLDRGTPIGLASYAVKIGRQPR